MPGTFEGFAGLFRFSRCAGRPRRQVKTIPRVGLRGGAASSNTGTACSDLFSAIKMHAFHIQEPGLRTGQGDGLLDEFFAFGKFIRLFGKDGGQIIHRQHVPRPQFENPSIEDRRVVHASLQNQHRRQDIEHVRLIAEVLGRFSEQFFRLLEIFGRRMAFEEQRSCGEDGKRRGIFFGGILTKLQGLLIPPLTG